MILLQKKNKQFFSHWEVVEIAPSLSKYQSEWYNYQDETCAGICVKTDFLSVMAYLGIIVCFSSDLTFSISLFQWSAKSGTSVQKWLSLLFTIFPKHTKMMEKNLQVFFSSLCSSYPFNYWGWSMKFHGDFFKILSLGDR